MSFKIRATGPTANRTYTVPDRDATILTDAAAVTVPQGGTGATTFTPNGLIYGAAALALLVLAPNASATNKFLTQSSSGAPAWATIVAGDVPTLNQSTTGSAATLTTPRAIYGNNFDGSAALAQVIGSAFGGTGNGFTKFSGPAASEKTFTLPNANATILTDNAAVTVAQGGWGLQTLTAHALYVGNGTSAPTALSVGSTGAYMRGASAADPVWSTLLLPNAATRGDIMVATAANTIGSLATVPAGQVLVSGTDPGWSSSPVLTGLTVTTLTMGATPATTGDMRVAASWQLFGRNQANNGDLSILDFGNISTDAITIGHVCSVVLGNTSKTLNVNASVVQFNNSGGASWAIDSGSNPALYPSTAGTQSVGTSGQTISSLFASKFWEGTEMTPPAAPAATKARLYFDNSGGKTRLMAIFSSGAAQQIAIQP